MLPQATLRNQCDAHSNLVSHSVDLNAFLGSILSLIASW